jgi:hypothetical protein
VFRVVDDLVELDYIDVTEFLKHLDLLGCVLGGLSYLA